ncbi:MAG TPA: winged helix-turn-helix domain-containing protein [Dehalococcoidia bacterium]|nr:winged helix-turn-helix domain-containing protein [Dehalococcoidia bacterium]
MSSTFPTVLGGGPAPARRRDDLATAHCVIVADHGPETAAIEAAVSALGPSVRLALPGEVGEQLWRNSALRVLLARGPRAVAALLPWMAFLHAAPNTGTLALLDAGRGEIISALEFFDIWLPGGTAPAVAARQAVSLLALLDRQTRLSGPRRIRGVNLIIDLAREEVTNNEGVRIPLTPSEYRLLAALAVQPGHVVDFGQLGSALPGHFRDADDAYNSVKVHVGRLRQKLSRGTGWDGHLVSVRGRGFLFERRLPRGGEVAADEPLVRRVAS